MHYTLIVARMAPEDRQRVHDIWAESDATELPYLVGVTHRRLFQFHGLYFQLIGSEEPIGRRIEEVRRHPLFQHRGRRVVDAGIDVAEDLQVEERGGLVGILEDEGGGLVDRGRPRAGGRIGMSAGMDALRTETMVGHLPLLGAGQAKTTVP